MLRYLFLAWSWLNSDIYYTICLQSLPVNIFSFLLGISGIGMGSLRFSILDKYLTSDRVWMQFGEEGVEEDPRSGKRLF